MHQELKTTINIVTATDNKYVYGVLGTFLSLLDHRKSKAPIKLFLIAINVSENNQQFLKENFDKLNYESISFEIINFDAVDRFDFKSTIEHLTLASYARLFIPEIFQKLDKILYLDCDTIIREDVSVLWNEIDSDKTLTAVAEKSIGEVIPQVTLDRLKIPCKGPYFNSGVLGINLRKARSTASFSKAISLNDEVKNTFSPSDQDLLDLAFFNDVKLLGKEWNFPVRLNESRIILTPKHAKLVHVTGPKKPWMFYPVNSHGLVRSYYNTVKKNGIPYPEVGLVYRQIPNTLKVFCHYSKMTVAQLKNDIISGHYYSQIKKNSKFIDLLRRIRNKLREKQTLEQRLEKTLLKILGRKGALKFIQIGSNDGKQGDPLYDIISKYDNVNGIFIEPVDYLFERLKENYRDLKNAIFINKAISSSNKKLKFYYVSEKAKEELGDSLPFWYDQLGSFDKNNILKHFEGSLEPYIVCKEIETSTFENIVEEYKYFDVDLLHMDTEGYDFQILKTINFSRCSPEIILYENRHLSARDRDAAESLLKKNKYKNFHYGGDTLSILARGLFNR